MVAERPEAALSVREVLEEWLPQSFAARGRPMPPDCPRLRVTVRGATLVDRVFAASEYELDILDDTEDADFWVRLSEADFKALLHGDPDLPVLLPPERDLIDLMVVDAAELERFKAIEGRLAVEITGRRRRRFCLDVAFGPAGFRAGRPKSTVRLDGAAVEDVLAGKKAPLQALLEGKIRVEGDRALAMQALMLVVSQTARR
ncbi:MAG: SCP2 sterol-binding domain-containing protein [Myxococcales bacterium]|nr:SCP2 sterol-binding domain-containing protein [Myxococcales bacterium]